MSHPTLKSYLLHLTSKYRGFCIGLAIVALASQIFTVAVDYMIKEIIDSIGARNYTDILLSILLFALYGFLEHSCFFVGRLIEIKYKPGLLAEVVTDMYDKTMKHSLHWFDSRISGEISSKITDFQEGVVHSTTWIYRSFCNVLGLIISAIFLSTIHYMVVLSMFGFILIYAPIMWLLLKKQLELQEDYANSKQKAIGIINDSVINVFGIKIIGNLGSELKLNILPAIKNWSKWDRKTRHFDAWFVDLADTVLISLMGGGQIALSAYLYYNGQITAGDFAFIAIAWMGVRFQLGEMLENILFNLNPKIALIKSSYSFIDSPLDIMDEDDSISLPRIKGEIEYKNITFSYPNSKDIFDNFNLTIKSGQRVGIVGSSGAGKTTFIKCLLRYFGLKKGAISIDGYNISKVTQESLRANISVIPQDITMFHRSIRENLQIAKSDATLEEIKEACKKAKIHNDIEQMDNGYDSIVGERGIKVSGGQRQRIAIARAILKNASILILDEATSALDTPTEKLIQESINEVLETTKATTIVVAHRLSTLMHMDRILVFDKGKIVEDGSHKELLEKGGVYKRLWETQSGGFLP